MDTDGGAGRWRRRLRQYASRLARTHATCMAASRAQQPRLKMAKCGMCFCFKSLSVLDLRDERKVTT